MNPPPADSVIWRALVALLLVVTANSAAWAAGRSIGRCWTAPLDFGWTLRDGTRLLGSHKTWSGFIGAAIGCGLVAQLTGHGFALGAGFGALALLADAASSFVKRRLDMPSGAEVFGLDQIPEALLPLLVWSQALGIGMLTVLGVTVTFIALDVAATRLRHP